MNVPEFPRKSPSLRVKSSFGQTPSYCNNNVFNLKISNNGLKLYQRTEILSDFLSKLSKEEFVEGFTDSLRVFIFYIHSYV